LWWRERPAVHDGVRRGALNRSDPAGNGAAAARLGESRKLSLVLARVSRRIRLVGLVALAAALAAAAGYSWLREPARIAVLTAHGEPELVVMDFATSMPLDPPPPGWLHRRFWTRAPMGMRF